jgi:amidase
MGDSAMRREPEVTVSDEHLSRRGFLKSTLSAGMIAIVPGRETPVSPQISSTSAPFELQEMTVAELHEGLKSGKYSVRSLTERYLERIEAIDRQGPTLHSVIEVNPDALAIADSLDKERKERGMRGPLHGIPVLIKDNIDTADRMATTAG